MICLFRCSERGFLVSENVLRGGGEPAIMLPIISQKLAELAIVLGVLGQALAAPAMYEVLPLQAPLGALVVSSTTPTLITPLIADKAPKTAFALPNSPTQGQIRTAVANYAKSYGVSQVLALSIAECESRFNRYARNPSSTAKSYFQFIDSTWKYTMIRMGLPPDSNVFNSEIHIGAAIWLLSKDGPRHWEASKSCWEKML